MPLSGEQTQVVSSQQLQQLPKSETIKLRNKHIG